MVSFSYSRETHQNVIESETQEGIVLSILLPLTLLYLYKMNLSKSGWIISVQVILPIPRMLGKAVPKGRTTILLL